MGLSKKLNCPWHNLLVWSLNFYPNGQNKTEKNHKE